MEPQGALESPQGSTKDPAKASMEILSVTWNTPTQSLCNVTQRPFPSLLGTIPQNLRLPPWPPSPPMVRPAPQGEGLTRHKREKKFVCQKFVCLFWSQNQHKPTCTQTFFSAWGNFCSAPWTRGKVCVASLPQKMFVCPPRERKGQGLPDQTARPQKQIRHQAPWGSFPKDARSPPRHPWGIPTDPCRALHGLATG